MMMKMMATSSLSGGRVLLPLALVVVMVAAATAQAVDQCPACRGEDPCIDSCRFNPYAKACTVNCTGGCNALWKDLEGKVVSCDTLTPRCILMHQESYAMERQGRSSGGRLDVDGLYDPKCFDNGTFKAEQSNETTGQRWCVNSAGVRNTDKLVNEDPGCKRLVLCTKIELDFFVNTAHPVVTGPEFKTKLEKVIQDTFLVAPSQLTDTKMDLETGLVLLSISAGNKSADQDVGTVAYYVEKQFLKGELPGLPREVLDLSKRGAQVWYYDDEPPRMNMKNLAPGIIAIICILVLSLVAAVVVIIVMRKRASKKENAFEGQELQQKLT